MIAERLFKNLRLLSMVLAMIVAAGLGALGSLPRQEDPDLTERFGQIQTIYPGATAQRVEKLVTEPIEDIVREIAEVGEVESTSRTGISIVNIELWETVPPEAVDEVWSRIRDKLSEVETDLPADTARPNLEVQQIAAHTVIVGLTWGAGTTPQLDILKRLAKDLEQDLSNMPGTKEAEIFGEVTEEVRVVADQDALTSAGLELSDLRRALLAADTKAPAGQVRSEEATLLLEVTDALDGLDAIRNVPILAGSGDRLLRVGDIARVERGIRTPLDVLALVDGEPALIVGAIMESGQRTDLWAAMARQTIDQFEAQLPNNIGVELLFDQSVYTDQRLGDLVTNLSMGIAIIVGVLLIMMGWRSALMVAIALPLSMSLVLVMFNLMGVPLHQISVTGLIIALGLLIDNAIIAVDEYGKRRARGLDRVAAIRASSNYLLLPLGASTITTALTFMPIVLLPGATGEFVGSMGLAVVLSIFASLALSLTLVPALSGLLDRGGEMRGRHGFSHPTLTAGYRAVLDRLLTHPLKSMVLAMVLPICGFLSVSQLVNQFFPPADRSQFQVQLKLDTSASLEETMLAVQTARAVMAEFPEIQRNTWFVGETPPKVYYNTINNSDGLPNFAGAFVDTVSADASREMLPRLQAALAQAIPQAMVLTLPFEQGPPFEAPIELRIYGPNMDVLRTVGEQTRQVLASSKNVTFTQAKVVGGRAKVAIEPKEDVLRLSGFQLSDLAERIAGRQDGLDSGFILEDGEAMPIRVQVNRQDLGSLGALSNDTLVSDTQRGVGGNEIAGVPLSEVADLEVVPVASSITRLQGERFNVVQAYLQPFSLPGETLADFQMRLAAADIDIPPGYRLEFGGEDEERAESEGQLTALMMPLMLLMMATVVLTFNSFIKAGVIGLVAALSAGLAFLSLYVLGHPMGFMAIMGMMGLIGLAINGAIIVMSALDDNPAARMGDRTAIRNVVVDSSRHIISTTLTTIGGFLPLILFGDTFWRPLASAIAGGVLGSAILALVLVPAFYTLVTRRKAKAQTVYQNPAEMAPAE